MSSGNQQMLRYAFAAGFIGFLIVNSMYVRAERTDVITTKECMYDWFFETSFFK
jgi:hypothetical protein